MLECWRSRAEVGMEGDYEQEQTEDQEVGEAELALRRVGQAVCTGVPLQWGLGNEAIIITGTWINGWINGGITQCWTFLDHVVFHSPRNFLGSDSL